MARVACTHPMNPPRAMQGGGVLYSRVAQDPYMFWRIQVKVDICRSRTHICHVVMKPQLRLIDLNRRYSSVMETRPSDYTS